MSMISVKQEEHKKAKWLMAQLKAFLVFMIFCIDIMNNLTIFAGKPRKQTHLIIVREKHLLHKVLQEKGS